MRLSRLHITAFKNLRDFKVDFAEETSVPHTVLVGPNGAGKSNLLEALVNIFSSLERKAKAPFSYALDYVCGGHRISIFAVEQGKYPVVRIDDEPVTRNKFEESTKSGRSQYLPRFVFGYYSGASDRFQAHFTEHQRIFYRKLKAADADPNQLPLRPLFLAKPSHGQYVLLAFYSHEDDKLRSFLEEHFGILDLESVLFIVKKPTWQKKKSADRFWGATGIPRIFLDNVFRLAIAPMRRTVQRHIDFRERPKGVECWNLFLDREGFLELSKGYDKPQDFFKTLESTEISDLLLEIRVKVKVRNVDGSISFRELSEGEQQLLLVLGLLRFTKEDEALFLLDEPDTHLNPAWSVQYLRLIEDIVGGHASSHIVMATHDPLVFAGLTQNEVRIMRWDEEAGRIIAVPPEENPRGMGVEAILTSDLFRLRSALDLTTLDELDRKRVLQGEETPTPQESAELKELTERLQDLPFSASTGDPLYPLFVREMLKAQERENLLVPVLTPEQRQHQERLAEEIVARLRAQPPDK